MGNSVTLAPRITKENAREMQRKGARVRAEKLKKAKAAAKLNGPLSGPEWEALFILPAFGDAWARSYRKTYRALEEQYAAEQATAQYVILVRQSAALATLSERMIAEHAPSEILDRTQTRLLSFISQLQRYTESERREITVKDELQSRILEQIVALAETTISDLRQREDFLIAMMRTLVSEEAAASVARVRLPDQAGDVIDAEVVEQVHSGGG